MKFLLRALLALFFFSSSPVIHALNSDRDQPIDLEADTADIDDLKGISVYTGNVVLNQGSMQIKSDKLTLYTDDKRELQKAVAVGEKKLATFKQRPEGKPKDLNARAETMIYLVKEDKIHLLKKAFVEQDGDTFSGDKIIYDTKKETVVASSKKDAQGKPVPDGGRVRVTIKPTSSNN